jgi:tRNA A-37 threonylcarbamoyl transferase component Bud32
MHPDLSQLLTPPAAEADAIARHLAACALCRRLVALARPAPPPTEPAPDRLPTVDRGVYGEWRLLHGGGMGRIFGAIDRRLDREVAIKMLPAPEFTAGRVDRAELERRLELEARRSANLDHPGIVAVHEVGRFTDGKLFYAMRLIRGEPLDRAIEGRPRLADRLLLVPHVAAAAEAIAFAHSRGVVHRDLKPQNLMIGAFGETQVIDWGLAQAPRSPVADAAPLEDALPGDLTRMGVGTAQYMPPEQAEGAPAHPAMDVYALGATLYHVLAGAPPYGPGDASTVRRRLRDGPPEPLLARSPELPPALVDITEKCMARAPGDRFATALDLARELRRFANGELTRTRRYSATEVLRHWARRHRPELIVAGAGLVALAGLALYGVGRIVEERNVARAASETAQSQATMARAALVQARGSLASRLAAVPDRRLEALELAADAVSDALTHEQSAPVEAVAGLFDALTAGDPLVSLSPHAAPVIIFGFDGRGRHLVSVSDDAEARVFDAHSGRLLARLPDGPRRPSRLVFSRNGRHALVQGVDPRLGIIDLPADAPGGGTSMPTAYRLFPPLSSPPAAQVDLADGVRIAVATLGGEVALFDVATGRRLGAWLLPDGLASIEAVGERLFVGGLSGTIHVVDLAGGPPRAFQVHTGKVASLMAEPGGRFLLTCSDDDRLQRVPIGPDGLPDGPITPLIRSPGDDCYGIRASAARDAAVITMSGVRIWRAAEPEHVVRVPLSFEQTSPLPIGADVFAGVGVSAEAPASCRVLALSDLEERVRVEVASPAACGIAPAPRTAAGWPSLRRARRPCNCSTGPPDSARAG